MIKIVTASLLSAAMVLSAMGPAQALTLTNRDTVDLRVQITEPDNEAETRDIVINADESQHDLCPDGCTVVLENGNQEHFEGYEVIDIVNGEFVFAE